MWKLRKHLLIWLLPLLALRALVPAGFMIDTSHGAVSVIVCPGHEVPHHPDNSGKTGATASVSICAFAAASGAAPIIDVPVIALASALADQVSSDVSTLDFPFGPTRAQQSRAPPYSS